MEAVCGASRTAPIRSGRHTPKIFATRVKLSHGKDEIQSAVNLFAVAPRRGSNGTVVRRRKLLPAFGHELWFHQLSGLCCGSDRGCCKPKAAAGDAPGEPYRRAADLHAIRARLRRQIHRDIFGLLVMAYEAGHKRASKCSKSSASDRDHYGNEDVRLHGLTRHKISCREPDATPLAGER
jgi:hypothetical protein